jgi:hypothetical protein
VSWEQIPTRPGDLPATQERGLIRREPASAQPAGVNSTTKEEQMSTQIGRIPAARAPRAIRVGPAAAIGLALLVAGLAIGLIVGRLQTGGAERVTSNAVASAAPAAASIPKLDWRDDYGTRHPELSATAPVLTWRDDYATRHPELSRRAPKDDYATRHLHLGELP